MNVVTLIGRLTANPELKRTNSGISVCQFTLAVDRAYTPKGEEKQTDFLPVVAWKQTAEFVAKYFGKGKRIGVVGRLQTRQYEDRNGNNRTAYEVVAENVEFADGKTQDSAPTGRPQHAAPTDFEEITPDDDLPF